MKFLHLSDLHLGKILHGFSMLDDQSFILSAILSVAEQERPDGVLIAGDVFDKPIPPVEAVRLFDRFLQALADRQIDVFVISGNHDSADRLSFGAGLMAHSGVYFCPAFRGAPVRHTTSDEYGDVHIHLLPFIKPIQVRRTDTDASIQSYTDAMRYVIGEMQIDTTARNILLTHQFVTGATRSESEEITVGGSDNVDADVFAPFDYVALGHLHAPQSVGADTIRYCGTPLKYSFSEKDQQKSVTVVECLQKSVVRIRTIPLVPQHDLREIRGSYAHLTLRDTYLGTPTDDYIHAVLTDEQDIPDAIGRLRSIYPNLMKLDYDNTRTRTAGFSVPDVLSVQKSPLELFEELYEKQNGQAMPPAQRALCEAVMQDLQEEKAQ